MSAELASSYLQAKLAAGSGDVEKAASSFLGAYAADPNAPEQLIQAFNFQLAAGYFDTAADLAARITQTELSPNPLVYLTLAVENINKKKLDAAADDLAAATADTPPLLQFELARAYLNLARGEKLQKVMADIKTYKAHPSLQAHQIYHVGRLQELAGDTDAAERSYSAAISQDPKSIFPVLHLAALYVQTEEDAAATQLYQTYLEENPFTLFIESPQALLATVKTMPATKPTLRSQWAEVMFGFATLMNRESLTLASQQMLALAHELEPDLPFLAFYRGIMFERSHNLAAAKAAYLEAPQQDPTWLAANIRYADVLASEGDETGAQTHLTDLLQQVGDNDLLFQALGDLAHQRDDFERAIHYYDQVLNNEKSYSPRHASIFFARGSAYEQAGNLSAAEEDLQRSILLNPANPTVLNYLGYLWADNDKNLDEAQVLLTKAVLLEPQDGAIHDSLGWLYFKQGKLERALKHIEYAVELSPEDGTINAHLGDVYAKLGRLNEAKRQWERALELGLALEKDKNHIKNQLKLLKPKQAD